MGVINQITTIITGFLSIWLLNRILSQAGYGQYVTIIVFAGFVASISQLGLKYSTIEKISSLSSNQDSNKKILSFAGAAIAWTGLSGLGFSVLIFVLTPRISDFFSGAAINIWLYSSTLFIPGMALIPVISGVFRGLEKIPQAILYENILPRLLRVFGLLLVYIFDKGMFFVVAIIIIEVYAAVIFLLLSTGYWKYLNLSGISAGDWNFSLKILLNQIATRFGQRIDIFMLSFLATASAVASFKVALSIALVARYGDAILTDVIQPRISKFLTSSDIERLKFEYGIVRDVSVLAGTLVLLIVVVYGKVLLGLFGAYQDAYIVLILLTLGRGVIVTQFGPIGQILLMDRRANEILFRSILTLSLNLIGNYLLIPIYGILGAAVSTIFAHHTISNIYSTYLVYMKFDIDPIDKIQFTLVFLSTITVGLYIIGILNSIYIPVTPIIIIIFYLVLKYFKYYPKIIKFVVRELRNPF